MPVCTVAADEHFYPRAGSAVLAQWSPQQRAG